ncbi:MAG TPA: DUF1330 domain-containing protein [Roseiarcus sp.]|jgi:uncharacterized protein (DUF1330 family)|nr:DUF1330 domain-containing protein [Roseiarcus sp.]
MPKGYCIIRADIHNPEAYAQYAQAATEAIKKHGGRPLVRGGAYEAMEGQARARNVVLEFDSMEAARNFYHSQDYERAKAMRAYAATVEYVVVEGV